MSAYRLNSAGAVVPDVHATYAFRDLPLTWTKVGGLHFLGARVTGKAVVGGDICDDFWLHDLHIEMHCPQTGEHRMIVVTRADDIFDQVERSLMRWRRDAIKDALVTAEQAARYAIPTLRQRAEHDPDAERDMRNEAALHDTLMGIGSIIRSESRS